MNALSAILNLYFGNLPRQLTFVLASFFLNGIHDLPLIHAPTFISGCRKVMSNSALVYEPKCEGGVAVAGSLLMSTEPVQEPRNRFHAWRIPGLLKRFTNTGSAVHMEPK
jgi:hypothetical protein